MANSQNQNQPQATQQSNAQNFPNGESFQVVRKIGSGGMNSYDPATDIDDIEVVEALNMVINKGGLEPRPGSQKLIDRPTGETNACTGAIECRASDGTNFFIIQFGPNFYLYDSVNTQYIWINVGSPGAIVYPTLPHAYVNWNNGYGDDRTYFCNGRDNLYKWPQALDYMASAAIIGAATITLKDASRFPASGAIVVKLPTGEIAINYSSKATNVLTLSAPLVVAIPVDCAVTMGLVNVSGTYKGKVMFTWQRRLVIMNRYGVETGVYYSDVGSPETFASGGVDGGGSFQVSDGDGEITGGKDLGDYALIGKSSAWISFDFYYNDALNAKLVRLKPLVSGPSMGTINGFSTIKALSKIYYPTETEGLAQLTADATGTSPSTAFKIYSSKINNLITQTFSSKNGRAKYYDQKVFQAVGEPTFSPTRNPQRQSVANNKIVVYDLLRDGITIFDNWPVQDLFIHDGLLYYLSNLDHAVYQVLVQGNYTDNDQPYVVSAKTKEYDFQFSANTKTNSLVYIEGFISPATILYVEVLFNHGGVLGSQTYQIRGDDENIVQFANAEPLGGSEPFGGEIPLGTGGLGDQEDLGIFRAYLDVASAFGFYTIQLRFYTQDAGARFRVNGIAFNPRIENGVPYQRVLGPDNIIND